MKFKSRGLRTSAVMVLRGSAGVGRAVRGGRAAGAARTRGRRSLRCGSGCCRSGLRGRRDRSRDRSHRHGLGNGPCGRRRSSCGRSRRGGFLGCGFGSASRLASSLFLGTQASLLLGRADAPLPGGDAPQPRAGGLPQPREHAALQPLPQPCGGLPAHGAGHRRGQRRGHRAPARSMSEAQRRKPPAGRDAGPRERAAPHGTPERPVAFRERERPVPPR